jgi:hypothetical protein
MTLLLLSGIGLQFPANTSTVPGMLMPSRRILPAAAQSSKNGLAVDPEPAPAMAFGSTYEQYFYEALVKRKKAFEYQVPFFGGRVRGGTIVDFMVYNPDPVLVYVDGARWHQENNRRFEDAMVRAKLVNMGYLVKVIGEEAETPEGCDKWIKANF